MNAYIRIPTRRFPFPSLSIFCNRLGQIFQAASADWPFEEISRQLQAWVLPFSPLPKLAAVGSSDEWPQALPPQQLVVPVSSLELNYLAQVVKEPRTHETPQQPPASPPSQLDARGQSPVGVRSLSWSMRFFGLPFQVIVRDLLYACKVIFLSTLGLYLAWILIMGQPLEILAGIYQGFNCGWTVEVANPWTCDK